jgi:hypothetical protein
VVLPLVVRFVGQGGQGALQREAGADQAGELARPDRQGGGAEDRAA